MYKVSKEDIKNAFLTGQRKRNKMLYEFYKDEYFSKDFTARMIAVKISEDLGIPISANMVFKIYSRIIKHKKSTPGNSYQPTQKNSQKNNPESLNRERSLLEKEFVFKNAEEEPKKNPFEDAFNNL